MTFNKDIIIRIAIAIIFFLVVARILGPIIFEYLVSKIPGSFQKDNDIDNMIKRQKERLRAEYGLYHSPESSLPPAEPNKSDISSKPEQKKSELIAKLNHEANWGSGNFIKEIQKSISKNYAYTMNESKISTYLKQINKQQLSNFLSHTNAESSECIINYHSMLMVIQTLIDEIRNKNFFLLDQLARKCSVASSELALAIQLKLIETIHLTHPQKEERRYASQLILNQYSEETLLKAMIQIAKSEANLWAKSHSHFIEELTLYLNYAHHLLPYPEFAHKKDIETAYQILECQSETSFEEVKKIYKKLALTSHPDKITSQNLPKKVELSAIERFNKIQKAYEIISQSFK